MDSSLFLLMLVVIVVIVVIGMARSSADNKNAEAASSSASTRIEELGIGADIIKQSPTKMTMPVQDPPEGLLVLTWRQLFCFGDGWEIKLEVHKLRSTSCETSALVLIDEEGDEVRFEWEKVRRAFRGVGLTGSGNLGVGGMMSTSDNPLAREWQQLVEDVRFGRIKKQA